MQSLIVATVWFFLRHCQQASENVPISNWNRDDQQANLNRNNPDNRNDNYGVRPAVKVDVEFARLLRDLIHPPSILPTSMRALCVWKIFVSLAILSSKNNRNFRTATSL